MKRKLLKHTHWLMVIVLSMSVACSKNTSDTASSSSQSGISVPVEEKAAADKTASDNHRAVKTQNITELVTSTIPNGWHLADKVLEFTPENLYEHIDGNAELYLAYDVVNLTFASLVNSGNYNEFIDLFIYDMGSPTNAFGIFSIERSEDAPPVDLGRIAYLSSGSYFVWKGMYYLQFIASDNTDTVRKAGLDVAEKISGALHDTGEPVWGLSVFPKADLIPDSIKFFLVDAMGLDFMNNTYTADYQKQDSRHRIFISRQLSSESADDIMTRYADYVKKYGKGSEEKTVEGIDLLACDMGGHFDVVFQKGPLVCGVLMIKDLSEAIDAAVDFYKQIPENQD